jgi:hypothetical protein
MLSIFSAVFLIHTISLATQIEPLDPILTYEGNIKHLSLEDLNMELANQKLPPIPEENWPPITNDSLGELDLKDYIFEDLNTPYLVVKAGTITNVYYTAGLTSVRIKTDKGISYYASVPDASVMFLLGPALIALGIVGRRKNIE